MPHRKKDAAQQRCRTANISCAAPRITRHTLHRSRAARSGRRHRASAPGALAPLHAVHPPDDDALVPRRGEPPLRGHRRALLRRARRALHGDHRGQERRVGALRHPEEVRGQSRRGGAADADAGLRRGAVAEHDGLRVEVLPPPGAGAGAPGEAEGLVRVDGHEDGTRGGVDLVPRVPHAQGVEEARLADVREVEDVRDAGVVLRRGQRREAAPVADPVELPVGRLHQRRYGPAGPGPRSRSGGPGRNRAAAVGVVRVEVLDDRARHEQVPRGEEGRVVDLVEGGGRRRRRHRARPGRGVPGAVGGTVRVRREGEGRVEEVLDPGLARDLPRCRARKRAVSGAQAATGSAGR